MGIDEIDRHRGRARVMPRTVVIAYVLLGAVAAVLLVLLGWDLLSEIDGPSCRGDHPFCTNETQQAARRIIALMFGVAALAYLLSAIPALRAPRPGIAHAVILGVILVAAVALITDAVHHLESETGSQQWFT
jgi:hypothetical protein